MADLDNMSHPKNHRPAGMGVQVGVKLVTLPLDTIAAATWTPQ